MATQLDLAIEMLREKIKIEEEFDRETSLLRSTLSHIEEAKRIYEPEKNKN